MNHIKIKTIFNFILLFSVFALLAAYFIQYVLGHKPCNLCLVERIPYISIIIVIVSSFLFNKYEKIYLGLLCLIFIIATSISLYHVGIELDFIEESLVCDLKSQSNYLTTEDILKELKDQTISCKDVNFRIFGLSLATINTIFSLILSVILGKIFLNYEKNK